MKNFQFVIALVFCFTIGQSAFAQTNPKIIAVISKASWCPTCVQNEGRVMKEVLPNVDKNKVQIVVNDLSDKTTKDFSLKKLTDLGLKTSDYTTTGIITIIDATTKKKISSVIVGASSEEILKTFGESSK